MLTDERVVLIDLENMVGTNPRPPVLRSRVTTLLEAAGPCHHAVVAYAASEDDGDTAASVLAALGVAPLRVEPGPDAAENALIRHAGRMQASGCTRFTVCSGSTCWCGRDNLSRHGWPMSPTTSANCHEWTKPPPLEDLRPRTLDPTPVRDMSDRLPPGSTGHRIFRCRWRRCWWGQVSL